MRRRYLLPLLMLFFAGISLADEQDVWLLVDTAAHQLKVMQGEEAMAVFDHIAIGRKGAGYEKMRNDDKTPLGEYRIGWMNEKSKFYRFFGFTYPNIDNAKRAYQQGLIGEETLRSIMRANLQDEIPPQNTPLGGQIGIHGIGNGDLAIHEQFDWTHGCIAMTNEQIDRLTPWIKKGTLVVIR